MSSNELQSPIFEYCVDEETGKCGVCGKEQKDPPPVVDDYYDRYQYFECQTCPSPPNTLTWIDGQKYSRGATYILCTNEKDDSLPERCCSTVTRDGRWHPNLHYTAHPIEITHLIPWQDMDNTETDWQNNKEKVGYYFNTSKHPEELTETLRTEEGGVSLPYDSSERFESFLKSGLAKKYELGKPQIFIDFEPDGGYTGFVGKCLGCGKIRMGKIWGD